MMAKITSNKSNDIIESIMDEKSLIKLEQYVKKNKNTVKEFHEMVQKTLLHMACVENWTEGAKFLVEQGALVNIATEHGKETALHFSVRNGNEDLTRYLLGKNALPDVLNAAGESPLGIARKKEFKSIETMLLEKGATENLAPPQR